MVLYLNTNNMLNVHTFIETQKNLIHFYSILTIPLTL